MFGTPIFVLRHSENGLYGAYRIESEAYDAIPDIITEVFGFSEESEEYSDSLGAFEVVEIMLT